jgi:hypothetical protein
LLASCFLMGVHFFGAAAAVGAGTSSIWLTICNSRQLFLCAKEGDD